MAGPAQKKKPNPAAKTPRAAKISSAATRKNAGAATATKKTTPGGKKGPKSVLVIVESPAKARTITALLKKASGAAGGGLYDGYTVDACNGHVTDLVGKRKDVPLELKEKTKGWDVVGVDVVSSCRKKAAPAAERADRVYGSSWQQRQLQPGVLKAIPAFTGPEAIIQCRLLD